jgi:putative ABC transport system ATP-binding protein
MALIKVKNLSKKYCDDGNETIALKNISFEIEKGEFVAITGPSGSGKSTLLHILGFLDKPSEGEYLFEGRSIYDYSEEEMAKIRNKKMGFVFQQFNLLAKTTVLDNVKLPLIYSDVPEKEWNKLCYDALAKVGLTHRLNHFPNQLSGGEQQRVAIARAIVLKPSVIFADEPTGNLDSKAGQQIMATLQNLNNEGHTILLITHETYTAQCASRIIKLLDGEVQSDNLNNQRIDATKFIK